MTKDNFKVLFTNASYYKSDDEKTWKEVLEKWEEFRECITSDNGLEPEKWFKFTEDKQEEQNETIWCFINNQKKGYYNKKIGHIGFYFFAGPDMRPEHSMVYSKQDEDEDKSVKYYLNGVNNPNQKEAESYYSDNIKPLLKEWVKCEDLDKLISIEKNENTDNKICEQYKKFSGKSLFIAIAILESLRENADPKIKNKLMWVTSSDKIKKIAEMFEIENIENKCTLELNKEVYDTAKKWAGIGEKPNKEELYNLNKLLWNIRDNPSELFTDFCSPNVIFCGAPSTGKTYTVKQTIETLQKIAPEFYPSTPATKYTQFHPSYTYQDFIEGIKPTGMTTDGNLKLEPMNGTFKQFCIDVKIANEKHLDDLIKEKFKGESITINYEAKFEVDKMPIDPEFEKAKNDLVIEITSNEALNKVMKDLKKIITSDKELNTVKDTLVIESKITNVIKDESNSHITINYETNYKVDEKLPDKDFEKVKKHLIDKNEIADLIDPDDPETLAKWPHYYYVVDEINRGDLSNIFGETFTLLEYRDYDFSGKYTKSHNCLVETTLSNLIKNLEGNEKEKLIYKQLKNGDVVFGIPFNIHFIGMMNDVDRSIDAFDLAFRRRFRWKYTYCNYDLIKDELIDKGFPEEAEGYVESCRRLNYMLTGNEYDKKGGNIESQNLGLTYQIGHGFFLKILKIKRDVFKKRKEFLFDNYIKGTVKEYLMQNISDHKKIDDEINKIRDEFVNEPK